MTDRRLVAGSKQKDIGDLTSNLPVVDSTTASPSSNVSNITQFNKQRRGVKPFFRDLFGSSKHPTKKQEPPTSATDTGNTSKDAIPANDSAYAVQDDSLQIKHFSIGFSDGPSDQWRLHAIEYSILVIDLFESLTDIMTFVVPDALGRALKKITAILEKLKVHSLFQLAL